MTNVKTIRQSPENPAFRLVELEDLVAGAEIWIAELSTEHDHPYKRIKLDPVPVAERDGVAYVYYHHIYPRFDALDCYVPLEEFLGNTLSPVFHEYRYWLDI